MNEKTILSILASTFLLMGFYLYFHWLLTGDFAGTTRGIDWTVYFLGGLLLRLHLKERKDD